MPSCKQCSQGFTIADDERQHRERLSPEFGGKKYLIPDPAFCPECRMQRRLTFRNERKLYRRKCDKTGESIISIYAPDSLQKTYGRETWWNDQWDAADYGRPFDFSRPFFEQYRELWRQVPAVSLWGINCVNAEYNNNCVELKDSYMNINNDHGERNFYCYAGDLCNDVMDCAYVHNGELCYECLDSNKVYQCFFSRDLENCSECYFSSNLIGCKKCFGCEGLRGKTLHLFNKPVTQKEWDEFMQGRVFTLSFIEENQKKAAEMSLLIPKRPAYLISCENCTGDYLNHCKNVHHSFDVADGEDMKYVIYAPFDNQHIVDAYAVGEMKWGYEILGGGLGINNVAFINNPANGPSFSYYCTQCVNGCKNLFGCVGLKKKGYCILNKQYTKAEYEVLVPKIIEHMRLSSEWGEFFPTTISPFAYNETLAQEYYPLNPEEVSKWGWRWREEKDEMPEVKKVIPAAKLPEKITDIPDDILNWAILCEATRRPFKIIPQELKFYRQLGLPIPHFHPDERHRRQMALRNPHKLYDRTCAQCSQAIKTTYAPERPEKVYCETCYLKAVY